MLSKKNGVQLREEIFRQEAGLQTTVERRETPVLIRLEGEITLATAGELKTRLLEWLDSGGDLQVDLQCAEKIDVTLLQLLVAAGREAARSGAGITTQVSPAAAGAALEAGFDRFPGTAVEV